MRGFAAGLDLEDDFFTAKFRKPLARGSLVHYPPQPPDLGREQFGVAPHTDCGGITPVWQDDNGGPQIRGARAGGEWVSAHPIAATLVVNIADLMARWTNDAFKSTPHRVVNAAGRARYSMALFFDPSYETVIDPRDILRAKGTSRYQPVVCGDYILARLDQAFAYRKS